MNRDQRIAIACDADLRCNTAIGRKMANLSINDVLEEDGEEE